MPILPGITVNIPAGRRQANTVIENMVRLIEARRVGKITRRGFLVRWGNLRKALFLTSDYQELREYVKERCGGICEICDKEPLIHVHHEKPVAFYPRYALMRNFVKGCCQRCHKKLDKRDRLKALYG